ncbi:MAG: hypothetical protein JW782_05205 [Candidatus Saganbacteria bacterium]|nr:hypothetical protein [Candidatus Saganbacteria bacterium]
MNKKIVWLMCLGLVAFGLALSGCEEANDISVPVLKSQSPAVGSTNVSPDGVLTANFDYPIDTAGITAGNLFGTYLTFGADHNAGTPSVNSIAWSNSNKTLSVSVAGWSGLSASGLKAMASGNNVDIIGTPNLKDIFGNIVTTRIWSFSLQPPATTTTSTTTTSVTTTSTSTTVSTTSTTTTTGTTTSTLWKSYDSTTTVDLWGIDVYSPGCAYAVGGGGVAVRYSTTTIGMWSDWSPSTSNALFDIDYADDGGANHRTTVVGDVGTFLATTNYSSLGTATSITSEALYAVAFKDSSPAQGWAVGANGTILATTNGGSNWTREASGTTEDLFGFSYSNYCWAVGPNGTIKFSTGGGTWVSQTSGVTATLNDVHVPQPYDGWIVGDGGLVLRSTNAGDGGAATWTQVATGTTNNLYGLHFLDDQTGWVCGENGLVLYTTNAGASWEVQGTGTTATLWDMHFYDSTEGWAVGANGTALKYVGP